LAEVDTSIYRANTVDPLAFPTKVQALQQGILQNRLLGQQVQGKEALGRAVTRALDPATGKIDFNKALTFLGEDPAGAFAAPEFGAQVQARERAQLDIDTAQAGLDAARLELGLKTWKTVGDSAGTLLASKAPLTKESATSQLTQMLASGGVFSRKEAVEQFLTFLQGMPDGDGPIRAYLQQGALQADFNQEQITKMLGGVQMVNTGGKIQPMRVGGLGPGGPQVNLGDGIEMTRTPEARGGVVEVWNPEKKQMDRMTSGEFVGDAPPGSVGGPPAGVGGGARTGRYPGSSRGTTARPAGPPLGEAEEATTTAAQSTQAFQKDLTEAGGYAQRIQGLNKASEALAKAQTGPGSAKLQNYSAVINTFFPKAPGADRVNSYAEAQKYLQDYANRRGAELGMGTDAARALVSAANPGVNTPKGAAEAVVNVIKGLERMQASQVAVAQAEGVRPSEYNAWRAKWNRSVDPAAFAPPRLTKAEWQAKSKSMGDKWPAYQKGLKAAVAAGVISPSDYLK